MNNSNLEKAYNSLLSTDSLHEDPAQTSVIQHLGELQLSLLKPLPKKNIFLSLFSGQKVKNEQAQGLYLHGGVGRGKTFLMDLFFSTTDIKDKQRDHFHSFMLKTHEELHIRRNGTHPMRHNKKSPLIDYAYSLAKRYKLLCLDELHVKDITDAMILGRLFTKLLDLGVCVVFTSNFDVDDLYEGGLQRELFLPFVELLKNRLDIVHMQSDKDYRLNRAWAKGVWFAPLTPKNKEEIDGIFNMMTVGKIKQDIVVPIKGREIIAKNSTANIARFDFLELCGEARGATDYLEICNHFNTIFLMNMPQLNDTLRNETRRFIILIDTLYDKKIHLITSSEIALDFLYDGRENAFEIDRTLSRIKEMQSKEYWGYNNEQNK